MLNHKLFTTSVRAWDAMLRDIDRAKKSIYIEMYIFLDDTERRHDFLGKLRRKADAGVEIVIVLDAFGSKDLKRDTLRSLRHANIEILFFSRWLRRVHRKILIVDERTAFIGGVNIGRRFAEWNDLQMRIRGRFVRRILRSFAYSYEIAGGKNRRILEMRRRKTRGRLKMWMLEQSPHLSMNALKNHYIEKISKAERSVKIVTPYFSPPRWLISVLEAAARRKVEIDIIVPEKADVSLANRLNYRFMYDLFPSGMRFHLSRTMNHSKILIIDDLECLIGSQNIDPLSFGVNIEAGVFFREKSSLRKLTAIFEKWKRESIAFEPGRFKSKITDYVLWAFVRIFHPMF